MCKSFKLMHGTHARIAKPSLNVAYLIIKDKGLDTCGWMWGHLFAPVKPCRLWAFVLCFIEERELWGRSAGSFIIQTDLINLTHCQSDCPKHCWHSLTTEPGSCCRALFSWPCTPEPAVSKSVCSLCRKRSAADGLGQWGHSCCYWEDKECRSAAGHWISTLQPPTCCG